MKWICKIALFTFVLCCMLHVAVAQSPTYRSPAVLLPLVEKSRPDTNRAKLLLEIGTSYLYREYNHRTFLDTGLIFIKQALPLIKAAENKGLENEYLWLLGRYYGRTGEGVKAREYFNQVIWYYNQTGQREKEALTWYCMGQALWYGDDTKDVKEYYLRAIGIFDSIGYTHTQDIYMGITRLKWWEGNLNEALIYGLKAVRVMEATHDSSTACDTYFDLANVYDELGQSAQAMELYLKSMRAAKDQRLLYVTVFNVSLDLIVLKRPGEGLALWLKTIKEKPPQTPDDKENMYLGLANCYRELKNWNLAEKNYLESIKLNEGGEMVDSNSIIQSYIDISQYYIDLKQYKQANSFLDKALVKLKNRIVNPYRFRDVYKLLYQVDSASGNYQSAFVHYQQYDLINDSIVTEAKSKQVAELQIQYETVKRADSIKVLQTESLHQQNNLQYANYTRNLTLGGIVLLALVLGFLFNRYIIKQRSNHTLEKKQKEINEQNGALKHLVNEKEWLLKEIHHRVKNNLQIVISLLDSQSVYLNDDAAIIANRDSQHRVHAMSLIHQKLYQSGNVAAIDMPMYIQELVEYLRDSFDTKQRIRFSVSIDKIELDVSQAVPLGLIMNEAITNSIKYAFPADKSGMISISLVSMSEHEFMLTISDNGIGLPAGFEHQKIGSLGMSLMKGLTEDLEGSFTITNDNGTFISIRFTYDLPVRQNLLYHE